MYISLKKLKQIFLKFIININLVIPNLNLEVLQCVYIFIVVF